MLTGDLDMVISIGKRIEYAVSTFFDNDNNFLILLILSR